jgi:hypothetical protein
MKAIRVALAIGIAILIPLLANMTVQIFRTPPDSDAYYSYYNKEPKTDLERQSAEKEMRARNAKFEASEKEFNTFSFWFTYPIGIVGIIGGYLLGRSRTVGAGLLFGGLGTISFASYSCWETLPGVVRYVTLLFTLVLLTLLAIRVDRVHAANPSPVAPSA